MADGITESANHNHIGEADHRAVATQVRKGSTIGGSVCCIHDTTEDIKSNTSGAKEDEAITSESESEPDIFQESIEHQDKGGRFENGNEWFTILRSQYNDHIQHRQQAFDPKQQIENNKPRCRVLNTLGPQKPLPDKPNKQDSDEHVDRGFKHSSTSSTAIHLGPAGAIETAASAPKGQQESNAKFERREINRLQGELSKSCKQIARLELQCHSLRISNDARGIQCSYLEDVRQEFTRTIISLKDQLDTNEEEIGRLSAENQSLNSDKLRLYNLLIEIQDFCLTFPPPPPGPQLPVVPTPIRRAPVLKSVAYEDLSCPSAQGFAPITGKPGPVTLQPRVWIHEPGSITHLLREYKKTPKYREGEQLKLQKRQAETAPEQVHNGTSGESVKEHNTGD